MNPFFFFTNYALALKGVQFWIRASLQHIERLCARSDWLPICYSLSRAGQHETEGLILVHVID